MPKQQNSPDPNEPQMTMQQYLLKKFLGLVP